MPDRLDRTWHRITGWLDAHAPVTAEQLRGPADVAVVDAIEHDVGVASPQICAPGGALPTASTRTRSCPSFQTFTCRYQFLRHVTRGVVLSRYRPYSTRRTGATTGTWPPAASATGTRRPSCRSPQTTAEMFSSSTYDRARGTAASASATTSKASCNHRVGATSQPCSAISPTPSIPGSPRSPLTPNDAGRPASPTIRASGPRSTMTASSNGLNVDRGRTSSHRHPRPCTAGDHHAVLRPDGADPDVPRWL